MPRHRNNFYKYAFAACLVLLLVSLAALFSVYNKWQQSDKLISALQQQNQRYSNQVNVMDAQLDIFRDSTFRFIKLKGTPKTPASAITVAWSPVKKKVMIDMAGMKLPATDEEHQYQLWAIVDGKPVDAGMLKDAKNRVQQMKTFERADAFAITLERQGGSPVPTVEAMYVMGGA